MVRSTIIVSLLAGINSVLSFAGQLVIARIFGASSELDAYFIAISAPLTTAGLFAGVLGYQVVPTLRRAETDHKNFDAALLGMVVLLGGTAAVVSIAGIGLGTHVVPHFKPDLHSAEFSRTISNTALIAWGWLPLAVVGAVVTGALYVREKFFAATALQPLPIIGALIGCLAFHNSLGTLAMAVGQLAGYAVMVLSLMLCVRLQQVPPHWMAARSLILQAPLALSGLLIFVIYPLSDAIWGARLDPSSVSLLGYSQRLIVGFSGLAIVGVTTVIFPRLARHAAAGAENSFRDEVSRSLRIMIGVMAPAATVFGILALPIVRFLFVHGAFRDSDAVDLASLLSWMCAGMVAMSGMTLAFKGLFAQLKLRRASSLSIGGSAAYFVLSGTFSHFWGLPGIGVAYLVSWWAVFTVATTAMGVFHLADWRYATRIIFIVALAGVAAWLGREYVLNANDQGLTALFKLGFVATIAGLAFIFGSLVWPRLPELRVLTLRGGKGVDHGSH